MSEKIITTITDNVNKTVDTIIEPVKQRMSNPIIGSFIITWIAFNWQPLLFFIFSSQTVEGKIDYIKTNFYGDQWYGWQNWFFYLIIPFTISCLYIWGSPRIVNCIDKLNNNPLDRKERRDHINNYRKNKRRIENATQEGMIKELRTQHRILEKQTESIKKLEDEITLRKSEIDQLINNLSDERVKYRTEKEEDLLKYEKEKNEIRTESNATIKLLENDKEELRTEKEILSKNMESLAFNLREEKELLARNMDTIVEDLRNEKEELIKSNDYDKTQLREEIQNLKTTYENLKQHITLKDHLIDNLEDEKVSLVSEISTLKDAFKNMENQLLIKSEDFINLQNLSNYTRKQTIELFSNTFDYLDLSAFDSISKILSNHTFNDEILHKELLEQLAMRKENNSYLNKNYILNVTIKNFEKFEASPIVDLVRKLFKVTRAIVTSNNIEYTITSNLEFEEIQNRVNIIDIQEEVSHAKIYQIG